MSHFSQAGIVAEFAGFSILLHAHCAGKNRT
jgi:hypothetical protein